MIDYVIASGAEIARQSVVQNVLGEADTFCPKPPWHDHLKCRRKSSKRPEAGEFRNGSDAESLCVLLHQSIAGTIFFWCMHRGDFDLEMRARACAETLLDVRPDLRLSEELAAVWQRDRDARTDGR